MNPQPPVHEPAPERRPVAADAGTSAAGTHDDRLVRPAVSSAPRRPPRAWGRTLVVALAVASTISLATVWTLIARGELQRSRIEDQAADLDRVRATFDTARTRTRSALGAICRLLAEDPRLKATLATADIDAATVDDILGDLGALRGGGFFMVLSPDGRVFAESGARELRGLDLSASSIVQRAERQPGAALGSWTLAGKVMDLSIIAIRYGDHLVAYLAVGQALDDAEMTALAGQCDCAAATTLGHAVASSSGGDDRAPLFQRMAEQPGAWRGRVQAANGTRYVTTVVELGDVTQSHRLLLASSLAGAPPLARMRSLIWFPPALVLIAILFAVVASRSRRST